MSNVVSLTARDGSAVEFVNSEPKQGAIKDVFFSPDRSYVVAFFRKELGESGRRRIEKLVGDNESLKGIIDTLKKIFATATESKDETAGA